MALLSPHRTTIRALFLDIDGTLITGNESISDKVTRSIELAQHKGVEVVLCTGRPQYRLTPITEQMPGSPGYAVCSNGGVTTHLGTGEVLYRHLMPIPIALQIIHVIVDAGSE